MKVLVISDTHGMIEEVKSVVEQTRADRIIHCGDFCVPKDTKPFANMIKVRGNCDAPSQVPLERVIRWQGLVILVTHGHKWRVKETMLPLSYHAEEMGAHLVLFGHSHNPLSLFENGRLFINPGSLSKPRGYPHPTFVELHLKKEENTIFADVIFRKPSLEVVTDRGGSYKINLQSV